ncbi:alkaline phosphatase family protein [Sphingosinicella sp. BN140058]|uniref:alkaline phosphatase family protein n=1 Tax=Sphingosinicella sp. BN140058 TaxID=1892855 RepID=UPI001010F219|nr:alkaline phosphatase family protein [Sphingosinicella sp. BN140058]QAY76213.1 alkaline phosphatase family protein [Sphingosinicella sp. BN140058]
MKISRLAALAALAAGIAIPALAAAAPPKLVVAISVDQFSADLFQQYRKDYDGGLQRLSEDGVVFPAGYQGHAATETCPGHSTILTGARPSRTGIIANNWFDLSAAREDKNIYCSEDPRVPGSNHDKYTVSPYHLRVPALGDHMKRVDPRARVAVAAGKDRAAIMMGGYNPDQRWWWGGKNFVGHGGAEPVPVIAVNRGIAEDIAASRAARDLPRSCAASSRAILPAGGATRSVGAGRFARDAGDSRGFRASPDLDRVTLDLADGLRRDMKLGEGDATDLLIVGLSATDYVGHTYGTEGAEMCIQIHALDKALGDFFRKLDATGIDYVVMLTADHGGHDLPERNRQRGIPEAARVDPLLSATEMGKALGQRLKLAGPVLYGDGPFGDMYVDRKLTTTQRGRALNEAVKAYRAHPQVEAVFTRDQILAAPPPQGAPDHWSLLERVKASYYPGRSGDLVVLLKPRVTPIANTEGGYVSTHGSPWDYDRRVPILFWRKGMAPFEQSLAVETADILPTLAALINVPILPGTIDGRCLDLDAGEASSCGR